MPNPITDGQLEGETSSWRERILVVGLTSGILVAARQCGVLSWPRVSWLLPSIVITAAVFIWVPEFAAGLLSASGRERDMPPTTVVRLVSWSVLVVIAVVIGVLWVSI